MFTHMPFLLDDALVCAAAPTASEDTPAGWKLHIGDGRTPGARLATGLSDDVIECSPALARMPDGLNLVFIGQRDGEYRFYRMVGSDLSWMTPAKPIAILGRVGAHAGAMNGAFAAVDRPEVSGVEVRAFGRPAAVLPYERLGLTSAARIAHEFARPWRMLVSGPLEGAWHTTLHDFKTDETFRVLLADGSGVYKASISGDRLAYAARLSEALEAREIRFAEYGEWRLEPLPAPRKALSARMAPMTTTVGETTTAFNPVATDDVRTRRERTLRANCAVGSFCRVCRRHGETRADLEALGIVDRGGSGCPRGLPWDVSDAALDALRPFAPGGNEEAVWCERFMVGTTPARCQHCIEVRASGNADAAARWLQGLADKRAAFACAARKKTDARRIQTCCGREEKEVAVYACARRGGEVMPVDCGNCPDRAPDVYAEEAVPC